jgi:hypothetical protein
MRFVDGAVVEYRTMAFVTWFVAAGCLSIGDPAKWCVRADFCMTNFDKTDKVSQFYGGFLGSIWAGRANYPPPACFRELQVRTKFG